MATTEPGGGDALLRERIAGLMPWGDAGSLDKADAILAEIAAAGMVIVDGDRLERLNDVGTQALAYWEYQFANFIASERVRDLPYPARLLGMACILLEPGDLDPVVPGDGAGR